VPVGAERHTPYRSAVAGEGLAGVGDIGQNATVAVPHGRPVHSADNSCSLFDDLVRNFEFGVQTWGRRANSNRLMEKQRARGDRGWTWQRY
jgi:hypothetical protein